MIDPFGLSDTWFVAAWKVLLFGVFCAVFGFITGYVVGTERAYRFYRRF